jgi:NTP pyrophosphatase (non-canonical NTP hydrolase)
MMLNSNFDKTLENYIESIVEINEKFNIHESHRFTIYCYGLIEEVGELSGKIKREIRDDKDLSSDIHKEIGDIIAYLMLIVRWTHLEYFSTKNIATLIFDDLPGNIQQFKNEQNKSDIPILYILSKLDVEKSFLIYLLMQYSEADRKAHKGTAILVATRVRQMAAKILAYLEVIALNFDSNLEQCLDLNIQKLQSRFSKGTLHGSGDNR